MTFGGPRSWELDGEPFVPLGIGRISLGPHEGLPEDSLGALGMVRTSPGAPEGLPGDPLRVLKRLPREPLEALGRGEITQIESF